jgi:hypothetical protein
VKFGAGAAPPPDPDHGRDRRPPRRPPRDERVSAHTAYFFGVAAARPARGKAGRAARSTLPNGIDWIARSSARAALLMNVNGDARCGWFRREGGAIVTPNDIDWTGRGPAHDALFRGVATATAPLRGRGTAARSCARPTGGPGGGSSGTNRSRRAWVTAWNSSTAGIQPSPGRRIPFRDRRPERLFLTSSNGLSWTPARPARPILLSE